MLTPTGNKHTSLVDERILIGNVTIGESLMTDLVLTCIAYKKPPHSAMQKRLFRKGYSAEAIPKKLLRDDDIKT
ncbi:hypothetical protein A6E14_08175 [Vibrio genomosp. F10]|uniref:Uncharacterized protein n=1 Tax=Vibrio genomosp. F10 TaxID=723171 RepID=A0A1B9QZZ6_9VIBR|nr:hypothetical protein A6E14_08175 [Vibrio genomosp. F10]